MIFHYNVATEGIRAGFQSFSVLGLRYDVETDTLHIIYVKRNIVKTAPNLLNIEKVVALGNSVITQNVETEVQLQSNTSKIEREHLTAKAAKVGESVLIVKRIPNSVSVTKSSNKIKI